jgi:hypothetical protein
VSSRGSAQKVASGWPIIQDLDLHYFVLTLAVGSWAILRSHSSTAAIGFLLLPFVGAGAGAVALVQQGVETVRLNRSRDRSAGHFIGHRSDSVLADLR